MNSHNYDFQIGDWHVDVASCTLFNKQNELHIEPKAMEVLQILVHARGKVVARETLMETVWHGRFVTDYALNNTVASLRKYLDAENKNKYIITRPKRGYQLNCKVIWPTDFDPSNSAPMLEKTKQPPELKNDFNVEESKSENNSKVRMRKSSWAFPFALCLLLAVIIFSFVFPMRSSNLTDERIDKKKIAVLPFRVVTNSPEIAYLAKGLAQEIINQLALEQNMFVFDSRSSFELIEQNGDNRDPKHISNSLGANYILDGAISKVNEQTTIEVSFSDELGVSLWTATFVVSTETIFLLQDDIIANVKKALDLEPLLLTEAGKYYRSADPEAFQHLLQGRALNGEGSLEAIQQAMVHFKMAVELDPNYASAYVDLGIGYLILYTRKYISLDEANAKAKPLIDKALSLQAKHPAAITAQGIFAMYNGQPNKAIEYYEKALNLDPSLVLARTNIAYLYRTNRQFDEALFHYKMAKKKHPINGLINYSIARILLETGQVSESYSILESCVGFASKSTNCPLELAFLQRLVGKPEAAIVTFNTFLGWYKNDDYFYTVQNKGFHAWWENDLTQAEAAFEKLYQEHGAQYDFLPSLAWFKWQQGDISSLYKKLSEQSLSDSAYNTDYQLRSLALLAYAQQNCNEMFSYYQQANENKPILHGHFLEIIEGFSTTLNMAACHIKQEQPQLAEPLLQKVDDAIKQADSLAKQSPGTMLVQAKLDSLRGKSINANTLKTKFIEKGYPHGWMLDSDWAFSLKTQ
jgi:DNA-binding winged helix-turn-helix (wHTH) protein/TolB-like protein/Tfp pilus assembly protein PilF